MLYNPDKHTADGFETIAAYDRDMRIQVNTGSFIEWKVFFLGSYEAHIRELISRYFPTGGTFVDVGANVGIHALAAAKLAGKDGKVIAIEPVPEIRSRLQRNIQLNGLQNVIFMPWVISNAPGTVSFYKPGRSLANQGAGSMYKSRIGGEEIKVEAKTLDEVLAGESRVDFIKIDTEGNDGKVILGGAEIIKKHRPAILFEYAGGWSVSGVRPAEVVDLLAPTHDLFSVEGTNLVPLRTAGEWDSFHSDNILCLPRK